MKNCALDFITFFCYLMVSLMKRIFSFIFPSLLYPLLIPEGVLLDVQRECHTEGFSITSENHWGS